MTLNSFISQTKSSQRGQALVEGTVGLVIVITVTIGAVLLLTDTYLANSYKVKLGLVTDQTANYLADNQSGQDLNQLAQSRASELINAISLPMPNPKATAIVTDNLLIVTITGQCNVLQTGLPLLPSKIDMTDIAAVPVSMVSWNGWLEGVRNVGQGPSVYMPVKSTAPGNVLGSLKCGPGN